MACLRSQNSALDQPAFSKQMAISGEIAAWPFRTRERVWRATPSTPAASGTFRPSGIRQFSLMLRPGGGEGVLQSAPWTLRSYPDLLALSGADLADPGPYLICPETDPWPRRRHQHQDRQFSVSQVLLVAEALICRDEELIALLLRSIEQGAIAKLGPSPFKGRVHTVLPQVPTKRHRSSLIEQYLHEATDSARVRSS